MYLNFLFKHGLSHKTYFFYRQSMQITKAVLYSAISTTIFVILEGQCDPRYRLYPSFVQLTVIFMSYIICLVSLFNMTNILIYLISAYWFFLKALLIIIFFFIYVSETITSRHFYRFDEQIHACFLSGGTGLRSKVGR